MNNQVNDSTYGCPSSSLCIEPPDPFVAAGPSQLMQSVNTEFRITDRLGGNAIEVSAYDFFSAPSNQELTDPRVAYDADHGRWLAEMGAFDCSTGYIYLAVSDSSDPTGSWTSWYLSYSGMFPDYTQLGFSSDKVALSYNAFSLSSCSLGSYRGTASSVVDWADLLDAGSLVYIYTAPNASYWDWRQASGRDADTTVHGVISEPGSSGWIFDYTATTGSALDWYYGGPDPLSITIYALGSTFAEGPTIVPPQDPAGALEVDERVTDAIAQGGLLTFVSAYPCGSGGVYDCVRLSQLSTSDLTARQDFLIGGPSGYDAFMGGIGMSADGDLYAVWSEASTSAFISTWGASQGSGGPINAMGSPVQIRAGGASYRGNRWGDYVGVAPDPNDASSVWQADEYPRSNGTWGTWVSKLTSATADTTPPTVSKPVPSVRLHSKLGSGSSLISWNGVDDQSGISYFELQKSSNGGGWQYVPLPSDTSTSVSISLSLNTSVQFRVRATDNASNTSAWKVGPAFTPVVYEDTAHALSYAGRWTRSIDANSSGGTHTWTRTTGAKVSLSFTGRTVAFIAPTDYHRGRADVILDGVHVATIDLYSVQAHERQVLFTRDWSTVGSHTIVIRNRGTAGRPKIDLDAFLVYQ